MSKTVRATVVKDTGSLFMLSMLPQWNLFPAVLRGKIRLSGSNATNPVAVGDHVVVEVPDDFNPDAAGSDLINGIPGSTPAKSNAPLSANPAVIKEILPRTNHVVRRSTNLSRQKHVIAANLDMACIVVTLNFPEVKLPFLDRILVMCEAFGVPATIILNKMDIFSAHDEFAEHLADFKHIYGESAGYPILEVSAKTGKGIDEIRELLNGKIALFSGVSGVGKSSLIKALDPSLDPKVGAISMAHLQGTHTTTFYEMFPLASGGFIIDSPGIRGFGLTDMEKEEIPLYFPEMLALSQDCRFTPCTHTHEPGCAVKAALETGEVTPERYYSYLGMLSEDSKYRTSE